MFETSPAHFQQFDFVQVPNNGLESRQQRPQSQFSGSHQQQPVVSTQASSQSRPSSFSNQSAVGINHSGSANNQVQEEQSQANPSLAELYEESRQKTDAMLDLYVYDYMRKRGMDSCANQFLLEAQIDPAEAFRVPIDLQEGFLHEWWTVFWDFYNARAGKPASNEALTFLASVKRVNQSQQASISKQMRPESESQLSPVKVRKHFQRQQVSNTNVEAASPEGCNSGNEVQQQFHPQAPVQQQNQMESESASSFMAGTSNLSAGNNQSASNAHINSHSNDGKKRPGNSTAASVLTQYLIHNNMTPQQFSQLPVHQKQQIFTQLQRIVQQQQQKQQQQVAQQINAPSVDQQVRQSPQPDMRPQSNNSNIQQQPQQQYSTQGSVAFNSRPSSSGPSVTGSTNSSVSTPVGTHFNTSLSKQQQQHQTKRARNQLDDFESAADSEVSFFEQQLQFLQQKRPAAAKTKNNPVAPNRMNQQSFNEMFSEFNANGNNSSVESVLNSNTPTPNGDQFDLSYLESLENFANPIVGNSKNNEQMIPSSANVNNNNINYSVGNGAGNNSGSITSNMMGGSKSGGSNKNLFLNKHDSYSQPVQQLNLSSQNSGISNLSFGQGMPPKNVGGVGNNSQNNYYQSAPAAQVRKPANNVAANQPALAKSSIDFNVDWADTDVENWLNI